MLGSCAEKGDKLTIQMSSSRGQASEASVLSGVSVLIVEDSWHVAKAMRSALEDLGMRVVGPVATTEDARRLVAEQKPKLALVDVNLKTELATGLDRRASPARHPGHRRFRVRRASDPCRNGCSFHAKAVQRR